MWIPEPFSGWTLVPGQGPALLLNFCSGLWSCFMKTQGLHTEARFGMKLVHLNLLKLNIMSVSWKWPLGGYLQGMQGCNGQRLGLKESFRARTAVQKILRPATWPRFQCCPC